MLLKMDANNEMLKQRMEHLMWKETQKIKSASRLEDCIFLVKMSLDSLSSSSGEELFKNDSNIFNSSVSQDPQSLRCLRENNSTDYFEGELTF